MSQTIGIMDYGYAGNIFNIKKSIEGIDAGLKVTLIRDKKSLDVTDKIILPGVGAYGDAMEAVEPIKDELTDAIRKKPTLGICLGMQILSEKGYEFGESEGLGIFEGEVMRLPVKGSVPHLGWAYLDIIRPSRILEGITEKDSFYFMHSYELINYKDVAGLSIYCEHRFISVVENGNIFGVQFHPEKSRQSGLKVMKNFIDV